MFKAGDWVHFNWGKPFILTEKDYKYFKDCNTLYLWQPQPGEWCWFWNEYDDIPTLNRFLCMYSDDENGLPNGFDFCEPFTGQLPSFLKDAK